MNDVMAMNLSDEILDHVTGGGPDGGAPMSTSTTTTTTTTTTAKGSGSLGGKKAGAGGSVEQTDTVTKSSEYLVPCPDPNAPQPTKWHPPMK